jgi:uncharacterized protein involved in oxidation of intracellular sulfur
MNVLFILNDAADGTGRTLNALRLACALSMRTSIYVRLFLIGSAMACARKGHPVHAEQDDAEALIRAVIGHGGDVRICAMSADEEELGNASGSELVEGVQLSSLTELSRWIPEADRLLVF